MIRVMKIGDFYRSTQHLQLVLLLFALILRQQVIAQGSVEGSSCSLPQNAGQGTCQMRPNCPYYRNRVPGRAPPNICGFKSPNLPYLCCPANGATTEATTTTTTTAGHTVDVNVKSKERISIQKCYEYMPEEQYVSYYAGGVFLKQVVTKCKDKTVPLIVGGADAEAGEFPFMVAVGWEDSVGYDFPCGGTLISENFVLTVAHCTLRRGERPAVVRLGDLNLKSAADDANAKQIRIKRVIVHPGYDPPKQNNDIGLLELEQRLPASGFNKFIRPACLWTEDSSNFGQDKAIAIGWGDQQKAQRSENLQKVTLNLYGHSICQNSYKPSLKLPGGFLDSMLCSGFLTGGKDSCQGDSGGPLLIKKSVGNCQYYHIIGATSFGAGCALEHVAGVYTRVSSFIDWIEQNVWL